MSAIDRVRGALTGELRTAAELGARCRLPTATVAECLRELRRAGEAEFVEQDTAFRWRLSARGTGRQSVRADAAERDRRADDRDREADERDRQADERDR
jgi:DNA-binding IclR family transcriptional regulator